VNVKLLRKVKQHILKEPKRFLMSTIDTHGEPGQRTGYGGVFAKCGTAACICGWAGILSGINTCDIRFRNVAKILGLNGPQADRLFEPGKWPLEFQGGTNDDGKRETARIAAKRIEHFIKTKGKE
jgi:hypothetical protein